jgi:signal peptidase II
VFKARNVVLLVLFIIFADQALKFYIKLHYYSGQHTDVLGNWFKLHFVENEGMAWGWKWGGSIGKLALTLFRLVAVIWGTFLIKGFIKKGYHKGFIICSGLIYAGALGNLLDSLFYGLIFDTSFNQETYENAGVVAKAFTGKGYGTFLHGKVVDMLYFPIIDTHYPSWFPFVGGRRLEFFQPIFNIADASISIGVITILIFQKRFFRQQDNSKLHPNTVETNTPVTDDTQVL